MNKEVAPTKAEVKVESKAPGIISAKPEAPVADAVPKQAAKNARPATTKAAPKVAVKAKAPARPQKKAPPAPKLEKPAVTLTKEGKSKKPAPKKPKLIRDSFTIPETDYALFASLKERALAAGCDIKKSELLRASLSALNALSDAELMTALGAIERIKTGRPKK